jgi:hypothetical protein
MSPARSCTWWRIANDPIALHYQNGHQVAEVRDRAACLDRAPRDDRDGELCAMALLAGRAGVSFARDLWDVQFALVELV